MATRETLKDLQARLAQRLQNAQSSNVTLSWLAVTAGPGNYMFPLRQSGEILTTPQLRSIPRTRSWFLGVVNIRGSLFGTVELAEFIAIFSDKASSPNTRRHIEAAQAPTLVTFHPALEVNCALQIHALAGLRSAESFTSSEPAPKGSPSYFGNVFFDKDSKSWQEIDLQALSQTPEFVNISA